MACADITGIKSVDYTLCQELEIEANVKISDPLIDKDGGFVCAETYGRTNSFTIRGKGDLPDGLMAGGAVAIDGITDGVTNVKSTREHEQAGQHADWEASGMNYPFASNA